MRSPCSVVDLLFYFHPGTLCTVLKDSKCEITLKKNATTYKLLVCRSTSCNKKKKNLSQASRLDHMSAQ